jgi:hypothetical protein
MLIHRFSPFSKEIFELVSIICCVRLILTRLSNDEDDEKQ